MVAFSKLALAASFATGSFAEPLSINLPKLGNMALFQHLAEIPEQWISQGAAAKNTMVKAQVGLKQSNIAVLQEKLLDISHPDSPNYGNWLSKDEVDSILAPSAENIAAVKAWLATAGIKDVSQPSPDWIEFTAPVSTMETLLNAKYENFWHTEEQRSIPRTKQYSVPESLHSVIDMVTPTTAFYSKSGGNMVFEKVDESSLTERAGCDGSTITPACLKSLYNVDYTPKGNTKVGTTQFIQIGASHSDYKTFGSHYVSGLPDFQDVSVSGGYNPQSGDVNHILEGNLDTQYAGGLASPIPSQFLALDPRGGGNFGDELSNLASYLTSNSAAPAAVSTSYGGGEQYFSGSYLDRVCNEFMKAGSMGISVFFSSGDFGVAGLNETSCAKTFYAQWPASCPWITSVGGTQFNNGQEVVAQFPEPMARASSGGGFSGHFAAPSYQTSDTAAYVSAIGSKYQGKYNPKNRGFPDVSLVSKNFQVYINNQLYNCYGTSASAPSWAALTAILNDYRKANGKANLGFLNPLLYGKARSAMRDVTSGSNQGCDSDGFDALKGWDPSTGLGSVDFGKLRTFV